MLIDRLLGDREFPPELPPTLCYHVGVVDVNGTVKSIGTSWACEEEAQAVIQLVRALVQGGYDRTHITVLCFYDAQSVAEKVAQGGWFLRDSCLYYR